MMAYIDPGSGLMLLQILAAAFCGFMLSLRKVRTWIVGLFRRDKKDGSERRLRVTEPDDDPTDIS